MFTGASVTHQIDPKTYTHEVETQKSQIRHRPIEVQKGDDSFRELTKNSAETRSDDVRIRSFYLTWTPGTR
jgi:hypothetical protein